MELFKWSKKDKKPTAVEDISKNKMINKKDKNFIVKAVGLISQYSTQRGEFQEPEYDLEEIKLAADADSYINIALKKYNQLIYKAGYTLKSDNDKATDYIKTRFKIMGYMTDKPIDILFQEVAEDLVKFSNAFLLKSRVERIGFGVQAKGLDGLLPIGGYFRAAPESIKIKRNKNGTIIGYEQHNDRGDVKKFAPSEVIHFYMDKEAGHAYGTPRITAALEDVKLLRRIEGNVISLIYRFAMPLYQWKIGLPQQGLGATQTDIDNVKREVENMAIDGMVFTNERTDIKAIGAEGNALDATSYLNYFEKRVFTALGVSEAQMGRSGTSSSADNMEAQVHDTVKHIQRTLRVFIENFIISELLLEGGFNPILKSEDEVRYEFNEINLDTKVKIENHEMLKFQSNMHTFEEARTNMGIKNEAIDEERLFSNMITKKVAMEQAQQAADNSIALADVNAEHNLELAKFNASRQEQNKSNSSPEKAKSNTGGKSGNNGSKSAKANKDVKTRNNPTNQHGTTSVKIKESLTEKVIPLDKHKKLYSDIYKCYETLRNDITEEQGNINILIELSSDTLKDLIQQYAYTMAEKGKLKAIKDLEQKVNKELDINLKAINKEIDATITALFLDIQKQINRLQKNKSKQSIKDIFDTYEYRLRYLLEYIEPKAFWFAYIQTGALLGEEVAYIEFNSEEDKEKYPSQINTKDFAMKDIPAFHSFCNCKISFKKVV